MAKEKTKDTEKALRLIEKVKAIMGTLDEVEKEEVKDGKEDRVHDNDR